MKKWVIALLVISLLANIGLAIWVWQLQTKVDEDTSIITNLLLEIQSDDEIELVQ